MSFVSHGVILDTGRCKTIKQAGGDREGPGSVARGEAGARAAWREETLEVWNRLRTSRPESFSACVALRRLGTATRI